MKHPRLRDSSTDMLSYTLFEEENQRFRTSDYIWEVNTNIETDELKFTWQPHGAQFTIHTKVPINATKFCIKQPPRLNKDDILHSINFDETWVEIIK